MLRLSDGGVLALDWIKGHGGSHHFKEEAPIVVILPGMSGAVCLPYSGIFVNVGLTILEKDLSEKKLML